MKTKIEKKNADSYLLLISDDEKLVNGFYLSKSELKKIAVDIEQIVEYDLDAIGDSI